MGLSSESLDINNDYEMYGFQGSTEIGLMKRDDIKSSKSLSQKMSLQKSLREEENKQDGINEEESTLKKIKEVLTNP